MGIGNRYWILLLIFTGTFLQIFYPVLFKKKGEFLLLGMSADGQVPLSIIALGKQKH